MAQNESTKSAAEVNNYDVIVIGGGISGLSAAKLLTEQYGLSVLVLEARDRVGGRTHTIRGASYGYTDVGGAYVGPTQRRVYRLATELGLEFYNVNQKERTLMNLKGTFVKYHGDFPPLLNPFKLMDLNNAQQILNKMAKEVPVEAPWNAKQAEKWDSMTYQQFIDKTCWTGIARRVLELISEAVLCVPAHEVSLLYILWYVASGGGVQRLIQITNGAQEQKFVGGSMQLSERMAERLGTRLLMSHPVIGVSQSQDGATVTCANGKEFKSRYIISAMPTALLNRVTFMPSLPALKLQMIQRMPMGSIIKTMMFYKTAFWRDKDLCGEMITDSGPILYCMDDTKPDGTSPCLMGFVLAKQARDMVDMSPQQRRDAIAKHYAKVFKNKDFLNPVEYVEKNWMEEQYSGGCYVSALGPGVLTAYGRVLREPFDRVYFAGTETATQWMGYMEGAIQAGERAAREILYAMKKISPEDIDQDEAPVPGFPERPIQEMAIERVLPSVHSFVRFSVAVAVVVSAWFVNKHVKFNFM